MNATFFILFSLLAYGYAQEEPDCSLIHTGCTSCVWICEGAGEPIGGPDVSGCTATDTPCGTSDEGLCKPSCEDSPAPDPDCSSIKEDCNTCVWTCEDAGEPIGGADVSGCTTTDTSCGTSNEGLCKPSCEDSPAQEPDCSSIKADCNTCVWTCEEENGKLIDGADVTVCQDISTQCGDNDEGSCKPSCEDNNAPGGNGSSRLEVFVPFVLLGTVMKMCSGP